MSCQTNKQIDRQLIQPILRSSSSMALDSFFITIVFFLLDSCDFWRKERHHHRLYLPPANKQS